MITIKIREEGEKVIILSASGFIDGVIHERIIKNDNSIKYRVRNNNSADDLCNESEVFDNIHEAVDYYRSKYQYKE